MREIKVSRINVSKQTIKERKDFVAEETSIHIFLNKVHYGTILCSPEQLEEMVVGHLLSQGLLKSTDEIDELVLKNDGKCLVKLRSGIDAENRISTSQRVARLVVSSCGSPDYWPLSEVIDSLEITQMYITPTVEAEIISQSVRKLNTIAEQFRKTGGVHVAALYSMDGKLAALAEDVGRHNAVDKVIGAGVTGNVEFKNFFLALSGRLTGDIVLKAARMRIPVIASLAAAISSGLEAAQLTGVTLIGFIRGKRMNVYTYPERITLSSQKL
ncbi:MAG: formate dehydrogenase accessory sulfurtransferase FdhD [Candidatus Bathyarchaeum sp.]|nr:MAG: formate dehydrogenase accessory sulfurtransferase FdhD [Candidatus Bathyarchaeum sp.]